MSVLYSGVEQEKEEKKNRKEKKEKKESYNNNSPYLGKIVVVITIYIFLLIVL